MKYFQATKMRDSCRNMQTQYKLVIFINTCLLASFFHSSPPLLMLLIFSSTIFFSFLKSFLIHYIAHCSTSPRCLSPPKLPPYLPSPWYPLLLTAMLPQLNAALAVVPIARHHRPLKSIFSLSNKKECGAILHAKQKRVNTFDLNITFCYEIKQKGEKC